MPVIPLAIVQGTTGANQLYNRGTSPWSLIGTLGTQYAIPDILSFVNLALIVNGYETPWAYNGVTLQQLTDPNGHAPLGAKHHALHQGFYWVWNTHASSAEAVQAVLTTALGVANGDLTYTAVVGGVAGNTITIAYVNDGASQPLSVTVIGQAITVHLATDGGGVPVSTAAQIQTAVNTHPAAALVVTVSTAPTNDGTGIPPVMAPTNLSGGDGPTSFLADGPSSLRSSDLNNPNAWPLAHQIFVDKDDGDAGEGIGHFTIAESGISPTTSLILFKQFKTYQMTGVFGSTNPAFAIQKVKSDMGCVAPRTIQFAPGFGLIRLTHRGFALFNGVDDLLISEEVRPLLFGSPLYTPIDWSRAELGYAVVVPNPPMYVAWLPVVGVPGLTRCFGYDLVRRAWTTLQFPKPVATAQAIQDPGALPIVLMGDYNTGGVRQIFSGATTDDTAPIRWQLMARPVTGASAQSLAYFRRMVIKVSDIQRNTPIAVQTIVGPIVSLQPTQIHHVVRPPVTVGLGFGYGVQPYGSSPYGGQPWNSECDLTVDLGAIGTNLRAVLSGLGQIRLLGLEYHVRAKPLRRVSVYTPESGIR